jgi:Na+/proline symporter
MLIVEQVVDRDVGAGAVCDCGVYAVTVGGKGHVVEIGLSIASVAYGCLLGVFLLGTLTKFATQTGATIGMVVGFVLNVWLWQGAFPVHVGRDYDSAYCVDLVCVDWRGG